MKNKVITGITPSGNLTLGNYAGAIKPMVDLQEKEDILMFSADLHGITTASIEPEELRSNTEKSIALYLAAGLDYKKSTIFLQSEIKEHLELSYFLLCNINYGELSRMTQYKDKSSKFKMKNGTEKIPSGLLFYPTLMAADILLYDADLVPVGKDQKQHIELTRNVAERMNKKYGDMFKIPEPRISSGNDSKIMSLTDPTKKMSKSDKDQMGTIYLLDSEEDIRKKIKKAITDSDNEIYFDFEKKPGVSNLIQIASITSGKSIDTILKDLDGKHYGNLKDYVAEAVVGFINDLRVKYDKVINDKIVDKALIRGNKIAQEKALEKINLVKDKIGFYNIKR